MDIGRAKIVIVMTMSVRMAMAVRMIVAVVALLEWLALAIPSSSGTLEAEA